MYFDPSPPPSRMRRGNVLGCVCLSVCVIVCNAVIFESIDSESSYLACKYNFITFKSSTFYRVGQGQGHKSKKCVEQTDFQLILIYIRQRATVTLRVFKHVQHYKQIGYTFILDRLAIF